MFALFGAGVVVLFAVAYVYGRDARLSAERAEAILIERENGALCAGLGLAPRTEVYAQCISGLTDIRRRQDERRNEDAMGLL
jgi:hypothetical protein